MDINQHTITQASYTVYTYMDNDLYIIYNVMYKKAIIVCCFVTSYADRCRP